MMRTAGRRRTVWWRRPAFFEGSFTAAGRQINGDGVVDPMPSIDRRPAAQDDSEHGRADTRAGLMNSTLVASAR